MSGTLRVGIYGAGRFANHKHIPNLLSTEGVRIVALADVNPEALASTAASLPGDVHTYADAHEMLARETLDALYSCVPAFARTDVEIAAARAGLHLFSEKPQALTMALAHAIDDAIREAGVFSAVGVRERYRPMFGAARAFLADRQVIHIQFRRVRPLPEYREWATPWYRDMARSGGSALDWGVHALDIVRYITRQEVAAVQAFYYQPPDSTLALSSSINARLTDGATLAMSFVDAPPDGGPGLGVAMTVYFAGGVLEVDFYGGLIVNGERLYASAPGEDPWLDQDRAFCRAARTGDGSLLLGDYHDALYSLAPILAAWESSRRGGAPIDVADYAGLSVEGRQV